MRTVPILLCVAAGLLSGLICTSVHFSFDEHIRNRCEQYLISTLKKGLKCSFSTQLERINLLTGTLVCSNVSASDTQGSWSWSARHAIISFSWLELLMNRTLKLSIDLDAVTADSQLHHTELALSNHIKAWINLPAGPIATKVKNLSIQAGHLEVTSAEPATTRLVTIARYNYRGELAVTSSFVQIACTFNEGQLQYKSGFSFNNIHGVCHVTIPRSLEKSYTGDVNLSGLLSIDSKKPQDLLLAATYDATKGTCFCSTHDRRSYATVSWQPSLVKIAGTCSASLISELVGLQEPSSLVGEFNYVFDSSLKELFKKQARGNVSWNRLAYAGHLLPEGKCEVKLTENALLADYQIIHKQTPLQGTIKWQWDTSQAEGTLTNPSAVALPLLGTCKPHKLSALWNYRQNQLSGTYTITPHDASPATGSFLVDKAAASVRFAYNDYHLQADALHHPYWHITSLEYKKGNNHQTRFTCTPDGEFNGDIDYQLLRQLLAQMLNVETSGNGTLTIKGKIPVTQTTAGIGSGDRIPLTISLAPTQIRLGSTYNIIEEAAINAEIDYKNWMVFVKNGTCRLNKGEIRIPYISAAYHPGATTLPFSLWATVMLHDCFIHWKKDMVSCVSGFLCLSLSEHTTPVLQGSIVLDKTHIQSNILSSEFEHKLAKNMVKPFALHTQPDIKLHIEVNSHSPVHIQTQFLTADAHFSLMLKGSLSAPELSGTIHVTEGKLHFPYQPLHITQGRVYFLSNQLHDPTFELVAKNRIKKYTITLYARGTLKHPLILFEATPSLTEGQIITLLLGGSEDGSLFLAMPTSLTSTLERLMFGPAESVSRLKRYLLNLFKPLKSIRIVPGFGDETGRGGLRGSLVIDVGDNLHARIQKNFDLSEDVRIEVEYGLSDSMAVRAVKDERGDIGAEIEKTWKFS